MYNTFILSNFNYSLAFWWKDQYKKNRKDTKRALHFMFNDKKSSYSSLVEKCGYTTLLIRCINTVATEVFKSLNNITSTFMNQMFEAKTISYDLKHVLLQAKWPKVTYGKHTFTNYGSPTWNWLTDEIKSCTEINKFKSLWKVQSANAPCAMH